MGIAVKELLTLEYFREFYVLAGAKGLGREIQGITVLEAPDCFHWTRGKEMILSSGYVISKDPDCILRAFNEGSLQRCSALMLKRGRYLDPVPEPMRALFDQYEIPLISIPFGAPWMEVMNQVNTAVMNRTIRRFRISQPEQETALASQSYQERKIRRILQAVEAEMKFPAFLYDISEEQGYYSSANFRTLAGSFGLRDEDFWDPQVACTRHTLCDYIEMVRFRMTEEDKRGRRVSWIRIPITAGGHIKAWFVLMEAREFLDYYDEYAIRIAYLVLQNIYEQVHAVANIGNVGFENFVLYALSTAEEDPRKLRLQASLQGLSMETRYFYAVFCRKHTKSDHKAVRKAVLDTFQKTGLSKVGRLALTAENEGVLFLEQGERGVADAAEAERLLSAFRHDLLLQDQESDQEFGFLRKEAPLSELKASVQKCRRALRMGKILEAERSFWAYEDLGPLAWLDIPEAELSDMLAGYRSLLSDEKNRELLRTLLIYLENNMNYSAAAEKLYVHINTIRKRIDKLTELLGTDWSDPVVRLNTELLLRFLDLSE